MLYTSIMDGSQRAQGGGGSALDRLSLVLMPAFMALVGGLVAREFLPSELPDPAHAGEVFQRT